MRAFPVGALVLVVLALVVPAARAESGDREVAALLTIRFDPDSTAVVWPEVEALLQGSPREGWREKPPAVFAQAPDTYRDLSIERQPTDEAGVLAVRVTVVSKSADLPARALLTALVNRLEEHLARNAAREQDERQHRLDGLRVRLDVLTKQIGEIREEGALPWPLSAAAFFETLLERRHDVKSRLLDLDVEAAQLSARRALVVRALDAAVRSAQAERAKVEQSWTAILKARQTALAHERASLEAGTGHPVDVAAAEEALARVRLEHEEMLADAAVMPEAARARLLETSLEGVEADLAVLDATRKHLLALHADLEAQIAGRRGDVLRATHREEELRILRDQALALTEQLGAERSPRVDVLRLD